MKNRWLYITLALVILVIVLIVAISFYPRDNVNDFSSCVNAGYPVMESYPRQCNYNGRTFVEEISWENDGVTLKKIPNGDYACFGCGRTMCIDPISGLEDVEETESLHCDEDFNVIRE